MSMEVNRTERAMTITRATFYEQLERRSLEKNEKASSANFHLSPIQRSPNCISDSCPQGYQVGFELIVIIYRFHQLQASFFFHVRLCIKSIVLEMKTKQVPSIKEPDKGDACYRDE